MDISVVIINYKTPDLVIDCVKSIKELTEDITYEIIVVDNASHDNSLEILSQELGNDIQLIASSTNLGFGKANNLGVKNASGEYIFLLNSDTRLISNAIKILYDYVVTEEKVGIVGGNLYSYDMKENSSFSMKFDDLVTVKKQSTWTSIIQSIVARQFRQRFYSKEKNRQYVYKDTFNHTDQPIEVGYIFGTDMMLSRELYNQVEGFDPEFFMYAEEEELSWRVQQAGYKSVNVPAAKIIHLDGGSFKRDDSFNSRQFGMRMTGTMTYFKKRFGMSGMEEFYFYKMLRLKREYKLAKIMRRQKLLDLTKAQMNCLEEQYNIILGDVI